MILSHHAWTNEIEPNEMSKSQRECFVVIKIKKEEKDVNDIQEPHGISAEHPKLKLRGKIQKSKISVKIRRKAVNNNTAFNSAFESDTKYLKELKHTNAIEGVMSHSNLSENAESLQESKKSISENHDNPLAEKRRRIHESQITFPTKHSRSEKPFRCSYVKCDFMAQTSIEITLHLLDKHSNLLQHSKCVICNERNIYDDPKWKQIHGRTKLHVENVKAHPWICKICGHPAKNQWGLKVHMYKHEELRCQICFWFATNEAELENHQKRQHFRTESQNSFEKTKNHLHLTSEDCKYNPRKQRYLNPKVSLNHEEGKFFECDHCDFQSTSLSSLRKHVLSTHSQMKPAVRTLAMKCQFCEKSFSRRENLDKHIKFTHLKDKNWCIHCKRGFSQQAELQAHLEQAHNELRSRSSCPHCSYVCYNPSLLWIHVDRVHKQMKSVICDVCGNAFVSVSKLLDHQKRFHQARPWLQCQFCPKNCLDKRTLIRHERKHRNEDEDPQFKCSIPNCRSQPMSFESLKKHEEMKHLKCAICPFVTPYRRVLTLHEKVCVQSVCNGSNKNKSRSKASEILEKDQNEEESEIEDLRTTFKCKSCNDSFVSKKLLDIHSTFEHDNVKFRCPYCFQRYSHVHSIQNHFSQSHIDKKVFFLCPFCSYQCNRSYTLKLHIQAIHLNIKKHKCNDCEKSFQSSSKLKEHQMALHQPRAVFTCNVCSKVFLQKRSLKSHQLKHEVDDQGQLSSGFKCQIPYCQSSGMSLEKLEKHQDMEHVKCQNCPFVTPYRNTLTLHENKCFSSVVVRSLQKSQDSHSFL